MFLAVILVPELSRKMRETPGKNSHQVWSKSEIVCTSYDQKTKYEDFTHFVFLHFSRLTVGFPYFWPQHRIPRKKTTYIYIYIYTHLGMSRLLKFDEKTTKTKLPMLWKTPPSKNWRTFLRKTLDGKFLTEKTWRKKTWRKTLDGKCLTENAWRKRLDGNIRRQTLDGKPLTENAWRKPLDMKHLTENTWRKRARRRRRKIWAAFVLSHRTGGPQDISCRRRL